MCNRILFRSTRNQPKCLLVFHSPALPPSLPPPGVSEGVCPLVNSSWSFLHCPPEDECANGHHHCNSTQDCHDQPQGYHCTCKQGYILSRWERAASYARRAAVRRDLFSPESALFVCPQCLWPVRAGVRAGLRERDVRVPGRLPVSLWLCGGELLRSVQLQQAQQLRRGQQTRCLPGVPQ